MLYLRGKRKSKKGAVFLVETKKLELDALKGELVKTKQRISLASYDLHRRRKEEHYYKLLRAGRIFEDAGILDEYDPGEVYALLIAQRDSLTRKTARA